MEKTSHLMFILPFLDNKCHLINDPEKVVGYFEHFYPSEMHYELDVIGIKARKSTFE